MVYVEGFPRGIDRKGSLVCIGCPAIVATNCFFWLSVSADLAEGPEFDKLSLSREKKGW